MAAVRQIIDEVRADGDVALRRLTERFDGVALDQLRVPESELTAALERIEPHVRSALEEAAASIEAYHRTQLADEVVHVRAGIEVRELVRPVARAGCYVPGGRAAYPSTVLMTAVPARVAGVREVVLCVPPGPDGSVPDVTLAAAAVAGVDEVYRVGGAQAVAAMAHGTESISAVDVIVGPGNVYVATAKQLVAGTVGVPSAFAGPSEVVVVADATVDAAHAAVDLAVQAEHGPDGAAWLITWDEAVADAVCRELDRLVEGSSRRTDLESTLSSGGHLALVDGAEAAIAVANHVAPEHLQLMVADPHRLLPLVQRAGAVFCGEWSPASLGDYLAGPNHVLPTAGTARFAEALRVDDFRTHIHVVTADRDALAAAAPHVVALADAEGLESHADSIRLRGLA